MREVRGRPEVGRHDRSSARHRLEHREPEPLVERRVDEALGSPVQRCEHLVAHEPERLDADVAPPLGADDPQLDPRALRSLDGARKVLARLDRADGKRVLAADLLPLGEERRLDTVRHDANLALVHAQQLHRLAGRERRDGDHPRRRLHDRAGAWSGCTTESSG